MIPNARPFLTVGGLAVQHIYPESFFEYPIVFVFPCKRVARLHGWLFQDSSFHRSIAEKAFLWFNLSSYRPKLQNHKTLSNHPPLRLYRPTETTTCVITRLRTTWRRYLCQLNDSRSSHQPSGCVFCAVFLLVWHRCHPVDAMIDGTFLACVLHGTGRVVDTSGVANPANLWPRATGWRPGTSLRQRYFL